MSKFNVTVPTQQQHIAAPEPVRELRERTPQAEAPAPNIFDDLTNEELLDLSQAEAPEGLPPSPEVVAQQEREAVPAPKQRHERIKAELEAGLNTQRYQPIAPKNRPTLDKNSDGGFIDRATGFATKVAEGTVRPTGVFHPKPGEATPLQVTHPSKLGNVGQIVQKAGGVKADGQVNSSFWMITAAVTENMLADQSGAVPKQKVGVDKYLGKDLEGGEVVGEEEQVGDISKASGNSRIGHQIVQDFARATGQPIPQLSSAEAEVLGDAAKEMYYESVKDDGILERVPGSDGQVYFNVTPKGAELFQKGDLVRKSYFPKEHVRPLKSPLRTGLQGESKLHTKKVSGTVKTGTPVNSRIINEAIENSQTIPNIVDKQRLRVLWSTLLPALGNKEGVPPELMDMYAEINSIGPSKVKEFKAKALLAEREGKDYSEAQNMQELRRSVAQSAYGIAKERNGANYITYFMQAYNGRISPQQSHFDPTSSKAVRFVTRGDYVTVKPGSRQQRNLIQMYAMMLVKDADALLPEGRVQAFNSALPQLVQWGRRLKQVLDQSMTDEQAEAVSQAIEQGIPINDPRFPKFNGLALDPKADADLIKAIAKKKEDGPAFIDGLIDVAAYHAAMQRGAPHHTAFNAYIDGKTNGIASNALQLGSEELSFRTGVLRGDNSEYAVDQDIDIRGQLAANLTDYLNKNGLGGSVGEATGGNVEALYDVVQALYNYKQLNKGTTMTFGYGKDMNGFKNNIDEALALLSVDDSLSNDGQGIKESLAILEANGIEPRDIVEIAFGPYSTELASIMTSDGMEARRMMWGAAALHAVTDTLFTMKSSVGLELRFGGEETLGAAEAERTSYGVTTPEGTQEHNVYHYGTRATSAAIRDGEIGGAARGGAIPGPVQSLDAATVAKSLSGKTWEQLKSASNGKPYVHTIYDAFKLDANGYDVMLYEINKNWLDAGLNWSYLEQTKESLIRGFKEFNDKLKTLNPQAEVPVGLDSGFRKIGQLLSQDINKNGDLYRKDLYILLLKLAPPGIDAKDFADVTLKEINQKMADVGVTKKSAPETLTPKQIQTFVVALKDMTNYSSRLNSMINKTNNNKKKLRGKINKEKVYQYYTH